MTQLIHDRAAGILTQLFGLILQNPSSSSQIIDLEEAEASGTHQPNVVQPSEKRLSQRRHSQDLQPDAGEMVSKEMVNIKEESSLCEQRQQSLRRKRVAGQTEAERWRFDTPPPSISTPASRTRWPPQYVSPPPPPQTKRLRPSDFQADNATATVANPTASRSSSLEVIWPESKLSSRATRQSTGHAKRASYSHLFPRKTKLGGKSASKKNKSSKSSKITLNPPKKPVKERSTKSPALIVNPPKLPGTDIKATNSVVFHFFLSNENLGAVPAAFSQCNSLTQFFSQAEAAWSILDVDDEKSRMSGVSVTFDGLDWPLIVPWRNSQGFNRMMEAIETAKDAGTGVLLVKVHCIRK